MTEELTCIVSFVGIKSYQDKNGWVVKKEYPDGAWQECTRDAKGNLMVYKLSSGYYYEYTRDEFGNALTYKNSKGEWQEWTRDKHGYILTYKNSAGDCEECTRDENGYRLTFKAEGKSFTFIANDGRPVDRGYYLSYDSHLEKYKAGCRDFTYEEAIEHWTKRSGHLDHVIRTRAVRFLDAIEKHHKELMTEKPL